MEGPVPVNDIRRMAKSWRAGVFDAGDSPDDGITAARDVVDTLNTTGDDLPFFAVVEISGNELDTSDIYSGSTIHTATEPSGRVITYGIAAEPIPDGETGRVVVQGVTPAKVYARSAAHRYVRPIANDTEALETCERSGTRLLWISSDATASTMTASTAEPKSLTSGERSRVMTRCPTAPPASEALIRRVAADTPFACLPMTWSTHEVALSTARAQSMRHVGLTLRPRAMPRAIAAHRKGTIHMARPKTE